MSIFRVTLNDPLWTDNAARVEKRRDRFVARARELEATLQTCGLVIARQSSDDFAFDLEGTREGVAALQREHSDVIVSVEELVMDTVQALKLTLGEKRTANHQHSVHA